jgi:hypothetical protein
MPFSIFDSPLLNRAASSSQQQIRGCPISPRCWEMWDAKALSLQPSISLRSERKGNSPSVSSFDLRAEQMPFGIFDSPLLNRTVSWCWEMWDAKALPLQPPSSFDLNESAALPFVIPTGAQRSGGICSLPVPAAKLKTENSRLFSARPVHIANAPGSKGSFGVVG